MTCAKIDDFFLDISLVIQSSLFKNVRTFVHMLKHSSVKYKYV